jgi:DNA-binding MarR family transcriptional regulator
LDINLLEECAPGEGSGLPRLLTRELIDLGKAIDLIGGAAASRAGINQTDLICLELLARQGPMSAGQVASALGLTTAAISAMASRLEAQGYARREMDPNDRRRVLLHVSLDRAGEAVGLFAGLFQATEDLCSSYEERDIQLLHDLLRRFRELITDQAAALRSE